MTRNRMACLFRRSNRRCRRTRATLAVTKFYTQNTRIARCRIVGVIRSPPELEAAHISRGHAVVGRQGYGNLTNVSLSARHGFVIDVLRVETLRAVYIERVAITDGFDRCCERHTVSGCARHVVCEHYRQRGTNALWSDERPVTVLGGACIKLQDTTPIGSTGD